MPKSALIVAALFFLVAAVIFVFADGARRIYSGAFFVMIGVVVLANPWFRKKREQ
jgi:hypothetical protein